MWMITQLALRPHFSAESEARSTIWHPRLHPRQSLKMSLKESASWLKRVRSTRYKIEKATIFDTGWTPKAKKELDWEPTVPTSIRLNAQLSNGI